MKTIKTVNSFCIFFAASQLCFAGDIAAKPEASGSLEQSEIWGPVAHDLQAGFCAPEGEIKIDSGTGKTIGSCSLALKNVSTNNIPFFWPPRAQRDEFIITDSHGAVVPKTKLGKLMVGKPLDTNSVVVALQAQRKGYYRYGVSAGYDDTYDYLPNGKDTVMDLGKYFCLTNPGVYQMTRHARIYFANSNNVLEPVALPPVSIPLRVVRGGDSPSNSH
jgi:hypothetical protein